MCGIRMALSDNEECGCGGGRRKFLTKQEKLEKLRQYEAELENELLAVRETIESLKK